MKKKVQVVLPKSVWLRSLSLSFVIGVAASYYSFPFLSLGLLGVGVTVAILSLWPQKSILLLLGLNLLCLSLGFMRMSTSAHLPAEGLIDFYNGTTTTVTGVVREHPDTRSDKTYLTVASESITSLDTTTRDVHGKLLLIIPPYPVYAYGDRLQINATLEKPQPVGSFDYANFLAKDDIFSIAEKPNITVLSHGQGNPLYAFLYSLRSSLESQTNRLFPEPSSSLLNGLLLGLRKSIPADITANLSNTGLTHIIAISGFNITVIISFLAGFLLRKTRRSVRFFSAGLVIILFTLLVGASASVVRAAIMGILGLLALSLGRKSESLTLLLLALFGMVLYHPVSLILDLGFQLSFLATLGLIIVSPHLEKWTKRVPSFWMLKETLLTTLSAQIMVLPLLLVQFEKFSLIAPLSNILVLPVISLIMMLGFVALLISFVPFLFLLAKVIGFLAWICITYIILVVNSLGVVPFASITTPQWSLMISLLLYLAIILLFTYLSLRGQKSPAGKQE